MSTKYTITVEEFKILDPWEMELVKPNEPPDLKKMFEELTINYRLFGRGTAIICKQTFVKSTTPFVFTGVESEEDLKSILGIYHTFLEKNEDEIKAYGKNFSGTFHYFIARDPDYYLKR